jgi:hypothetical protein
MEWIYSSSTKGERKILLDSCARAEKAEEVVESNACEIPRAFIFTNFRQACLEKKVKGLRWGPIIKDDVRNNSVLWATLISGVKTVGGQDVHTYTYLFVNRGLRHGIKRLSPICRCQWNVPVCG